MWKHWQKAEEKEELQKAFDEEIAKRAEEDAENQLLLCFGERVLSEKSLKFWFEVDQADWDAKEAELRAAEDGVEPEQCFVFHIQMWFF